MAGLSIGGLGLHQLRGGNAPSNADRSSMINGLETMER